MKSLKIKNHLRRLFTIIVIIVPLMISSGNAQNNNVRSLQDLERIEDQNLDYIKKINEIIKDYPAFSYSFEIEGGEIVNVNVTGVDNVIDRKRIEVAILDLQQNKNMIKNTANRIGVFYSIDEQPEYNGENQLRSELQDNLTYPEDARDWGVEGTIIVKFVVDENGQIPFASTSSDVETTVEAYVNDLEQQAIMAVKATSGKWKPGKVNGVEVPSMVVLPVTFDIRRDPFISGFIY